MPDFFTGPVVCNTGPLLGLYRIRQVVLLGAMFPKVILPLEVVEELTSSSHDDVEGVRGAISGLSLLDRPCQIDVPLLARIGRGETAVMVTARAQNIPHVIIDERRGRHIAQLVFGLKVKGTLGILLAAKQRGLINAVRPLIQGMMDERYYFSARLVNECLLRAGELT
ncbi:MAG: uncharacterized protein QOG91_515 [Candidatus Parcubacteria bacterium]|jgi:predicted nucleic acid-binding protein|nr:uncharacterized protein [Candidatus Parcubacteria bacterium]